MYRMINAPHSTMKPWIFMKFGELLADTMLIEDRRSVWRNLVHTSINRHGSNKKARWSKFRRLSFFPAYPRLPIDFLEVSDLNPVRFLWIYWHSLRERSRSIIERAALSEIERMWTILNSPIDQGCPRRILDEVTVRMTLTIIITGGKSSSTRKMSCSTNPSSVGRIDDRAGRARTAPPHLSLHGSGQRRPDAAGNSPFWSYWWCIDSRLHEWKSRESKRNNGFY